MKFICSYLDEPISFEEGAFCSLVIENQNAFRGLLEEFYQQMEHNVQGKVFFSEHGEMLSMAKFCDLITSFAPFELNQKKLLSAIASALERTAVDEAFYVRTRELLFELENYVNDLSYSLSCSTICTKLTPGSLIKSCGIELQDDYLDTTEKIFDYMELMREFKGTKLFITVNMRGFFTDDAIQAFCDTAVGHKIPLLMLEAWDYPLLRGEKRITIDRDLCVF